MKRILSLVLALVFLVSPLCVAAQETPDENTETTQQEKIVDSVPVYLFADENGDVFGVIPLEDGSFLAISKDLSGYGAGIEQVIFTGQEYDAATGLNYMNARYYDGAYGKFISQDPAFLAVGDTNKFQALTSQDLMEQLSDPQQLNSYSYARNNPLRYTDPTGNINRDNLYHPSTYASTIGQASAWFAASLGFNLIGRPLTGALMRHSLTIDPSPITITQQNQKSWGNVVGQIQKSSDFKNYMNGYLAADGKDGAINHTYDSTNGTIEFNQGDLKTGIHGTYSTTVQGTQNKDGTWNLNVAISDMYDYTNQSYQGGEGNNVLTGANNAANFSQDQGVISNYGVNITFNIPNYDPNSKK